MDTGKLLIASGLILVIVGLIFKYAPWILDWFGNLPGDIRIENSNSRIFIPVTSMIVVSLILTLITNFWLHK